MTTTAIRSLGNNDNIRVRQTAANESSRKRFISVRGSRMVAPLFREIVHLTLRRGDKNLWQIVFFAPLEPLLLSASR